MGNPPKRAVTNAKWPNFEKYLKVNLEVNLEVNLKVNLKSKWVLFTLFPNELTEW